MFRHSVSQFLFVTSLYRGDIHMEVSLLMKSVKSPDEDDWGKLKIFSKYLKVTNHMELTLIVDSFSVVNWWIDAS